MQENLFKVVLTGVLSDGDPAAVQTKLAALFKVTGDQAAALLRRTGHVVKTGLDEATAARYKGALEAAGAACRIEPDNSVDAGSVSSNETTIVTTTPSAAMHYEAACWSCGAIRANSNFCTVCGKLQQGTIQSAIQSNNNTGDNPADLIDMQEAAGQPITNDAVLAFRHQLATALKGGRLIAAAQREFTERLLPAFRLGLAGENLFDIWLQFWEANEKQVQDVDAIIAEIRDDLSDYDQQAFFEKTAKLIDEVNAGQRSVVHLAAFRENISAAADAIKSVKASVEMARQLLRAQAAIDKLKPRCLIYLNIDQFSREVAQAVEITEQLDNMLDADDSTDSAIKARLILAERGCGAIVGLKGDQIFIGKEEVYLYQKIKPIPSLRRVWISGDKHVSTRLSAQHEAVHADLALQLRRVTEFINATNEEIRDSNEKSGQMDSAADLVENLARRQQELRQLSEGKSVSAMVTSAWGANAGAFVEGLGKNK